MLEYGVIAADLQRHGQRKQLGNGLHREADIGISCFKYLSILGSDAETYSFRTGLAEFRNVSGDGTLAGHLFAS